MNYIKIKNTTFSKLNRIEFNLIKKIKEETNWTNELFFEQRTKIYFLYFKNKPIGTALISKREYIESGKWFNRIINKHNFLTNVFIDKEYRKNGYGAMLIKKIISKKENKFNF